MAKKVEEDGIIQTGLVETRRNAYEYLVWKTFLSFLPLFIEIPFCVCSGLNLPPLCCVRIIEATFDLLLPPPFICWRLNDTHTHLI